MKLSSLFTKAISTGLAKRAIGTCSEWAERYRVMGAPFPGPWSFRNSPWTREMHDCSSDIIVGQKSAQMGYSEWALNRALHNIDQKHQSCLYLMPTDFVASDFSTSRFDPILQESAHLGRLFSDTKNITTKRAGTAILYIRGTNSTSKLKSISTPLVIFDELDEMNEANVRLAEERSSGQPEHTWIYLSTPTVPGLGINKLFLESSQDHFFFRCPHCSKLIELKFPDSLVITADDPNDPRVMDSYLICTECKMELPHTGKRDFESTGIWVPSRHDRIARGFYINQLYSIALHPGYIARDAILATTNPTIEQEFFNSKLGMPRIVKGAQIDDQMINNCVGSYTSRPNRFKRNSVVTMGVDVGSKLNVEITEYIVDGDTSDMTIATKGRVLLATTKTEFHELDQLMLDYNVNCCVIDNQPETRASYEFARRWMGKVYLCVYSSGAAGREITQSTRDLRVCVNRTVWLDASLGRIKAGSISLPSDIPLEYRQHLKTLIRVQKPDKDGNPVASYVHDESKPDHYAHARNYNEIALNICVVGISANIKWRTQ